MSTTTSTKPFSKMTRAQAIELCYVLEEQRDEARRLMAVDFERARVAEDRIAAALHELADVTDNDYATTVAAAVRHILTEPTP